MADRRLDHLHAFSAGNGGNEARRGAGRGAEAEPRASLVLVIRHGYVVKEKYYPPFNADTADELYSCTKSFVSALVGIAIDKGYIAGVSQPVLGFFPDRKFEKMDSRKKAMTLEDLLTMSSGLGWVEGDAAYRQMYVTQPRLGEVRPRPPHGRRAGTAVQLQLGQHAHPVRHHSEDSPRRTCTTLPASSLFSPLGIASPGWDRDPTGIPIGGWGLKLTPRDMAKLGYLYLHEGVWDGKQVVPAAWVRNSTRPHIEAGGCHAVRLPVVDLSAGKWFAALGRFGQSIFVVPSLDLVVVFTARIDSNES